MEVAPEPPSSTPTGPVTVVPTNGANGVGAIVAEVMVSLAREGRKELENPKPAVAAAPDRSRLALRIASATALGLAAWIFAHEAGNSDFEDQQKETMAIVEGNRAAIQELIRVLAEQNPEKASKIEGVQWKLKR